MQFKSKHEATISFTEESFAKLLDKEWNELECVMVDGLMDEPSVAVSPAFAIPETIIKYNKEMQHEQPKPYHPDQAVLGLKRLSTWRSLLRAAAHPRCA